MRIEVNDYKVEIEDVAYISPNFIEYPQRAKIFLNHNDKKKEKILFRGVIDINDIYKKIENGEPLNLDYAFVKNFSMNEYRTLHHLLKETIVDVTDFSAEHTVFKSYEENDFSFVQFLGNRLTFDNAFFLAGASSFKGSMFKNKNVDFTHCFFENGNVDFSKSMFESNEISFKNTSFNEGLKNFRYIDFGTGNISFINTDFGDGDVSFINTNFGKGLTSFKISRFGKGRKDFQYSKFGDGDVVFEKVDFGDGRVDFRNSEFYARKISFNRSRFGRGDVDFEGCEMQSGKLYLKRAIFTHGRLAFDNVILKNTELSLEGTILPKGELSFHNAIIEKISLRDCHLDSFVDIRVQDANIIDLSNTIIRDIIDFRSNGNKNPFRGEIIFSGVQLIGRIYIDWIRNDIKKMIINQQTTHRDKAEQFRVLKENFNVIGQYDYEDKAYVEFKRHEMKDELSENIKKSKYAPYFYYPLYGFKNLLFDKMGLYATNPVRVFASMIVVFVLFSCLYILAPHFFEGYILNANSNCNSVQYAQDCLYFSGVTFFTIGYGDYYPSGVFRVMSVVEGFTGVFMMSYFTVAFVRKILR